MLIKFVYFLTRIMSSSQTSRCSLGSHDRKLRYRALLEDLSTLEDEGSNNVQRIEKTAQAVQQAKSLLADGGVEERVKHPGEGYLDSRVLRGTSDLAIRCSEAVSGNSNMYDRHDLAQHIRENPEYWEVMFPREVPTCGFVFGTFAPTPGEQRPRAPRLRREKQQVAQLQAPKAVHKLEEQEEGAELVSAAHRHIVRRYRAANQPLSYFHLVLHPTSFAASVENIYYVSFLVRDNKIKMHIDDEYGLPFVSPVSSKEQEGSDNTDENQFIVSLDVHRWKELVEAFNIEKPMMELKKT